MCMYALMDDGWWMDRMAGCVGAWVCECECE